MVGNGDERPVVSRSLMTAVIGMGVLIIVGTAVLIILVVVRIAHGHVADRAVESTEDVPVVTAFPAAHGERIAGFVARRDGTVLIRLRGTVGDTIVVWDPLRHRIVAEFMLAPAASGGSDVGDSGRSSP